MSLPYRFSFCDFPLQSHMLVVISKEIILQFLRIYACDSHKFKIRKKKVHSIHAKPQLSSQDANVKHTSQVIISAHKIQTISRAQNRYIESNQFNSTQFSSAQVKSSPVRSGLNQFIKSQVNSRFAALHSARL